MTNRPVSGNYIQGNPNTHPGMPVGQDRVPAWLAPNEFVVNAEATQMYGPQIEAMNNHGRAVQQQDAGVPPAVPEAQYFAGGGFVEMLANMFGTGVAPQAPANPGPQVMTQVPQMQAPPAPDQNIDIFSGDSWARYADTVASIESGGRSDPYSIYGGANDHYVGKYQLGSAAIADASKLLGIDDVPSRETVRKDPALQEKLFNAYTQGNHKSLMGRSEEYRNMDPAGRQRMLGYAHNQGAGGASKFMSTGAEGRDAFGTSGLKYSNAIGAAQGDPAWTPQTAAAGMAPEQVDQMFPVGAGLPQAGTPPPIDTSAWSSFSMGEPVPNQDTGIPAPGQVPGFAPSGAAKVFADPAYKVMADRSGLGAQGYWDSLHPQAQEQHLQRVNASPAIYTDQSEMDVSNRVGANSGANAALPSDYDMALTSFGYEGMPGQPAVPAGMDTLPGVPGVDVAPNMAMPGQLGVPGIDAAPIHPDAQKNAYQQYGESRMEADYQSQQELDRITLQLQTTTRDAPAYESLQQRRAQLLQNLGRTDPSFSGSAIPNPEALSTDILTNQNNAANAEAEVAAQTQAIQDAASRGDIPALNAAEAALKAAHQQRADTQTEAEDMSRIRRENEVEDQARQDSDIQLDITKLDGAIKSATTPEGITALTQARDAKVAQLGTPPMPPAGQTADGVPSIDSTVPPKVGVPDVADVETKIAEAEATVEPGDTVLETATAESVEAAGAQAAAENPSALSGALGSLKDFFGDMFDMDELKRMAILYVGARVTGAGHGSSLAFAGKSYLSRLGAREAEYKAAAGAGKYTKKSIAAYKLSNDPADLDLLKVAPTATGETKTWWDRETGKAVQLEKYDVKNGSSLWINENGQQINPLTLDAKEPQSDFEARMDIEKAIGDKAEEFYNTNGVYTDKDGKEINLVQVGPKTLVGQAAGWAQANGYNVEALDKEGILDKAMMDMFNDKSPGKKSSIVPYLELNNLRYESSQGEDMLANGTNEDGSVKALSPSVLQVVNAGVVADARLDPSWAKASKQEILTKAYSTAWSGYKDLSTEERALWEKKSSDDTSGFIEYFTSLYD